MVVLINSHNQTNFLNYEMPLVSMVTSYLAMPPPGTADALSLSLSFSRSFRNLCGDDTPMVRRAAAGKLGVSCQFLSSLKQPPVVLVSHAERSNSVSVRIGSLHLPLALYPGDGSEFVWAHYRFVRHKLHLICKQTFCVEQ